RSLLSWPFNLHMNSVKKSARFGLAGIMAPLIFVLAMLACGLGTTADSDQDFLAAEDAAAEPMQPEATQALETGDQPDPGEAAEEVNPPKTSALRTIPERRLLTFEWPDRIRVGDSDILRLALVLDENGLITPTAVFDDNEILGQAVAIEDMYDTHFIRAEARLDLAGAEIEPRGTVMQRMLPGEPVIFTWSISPNDTGTIRGNVWMFIRYLPMEGVEGEEVEKLIFTQPLEIQATNVLGLGGLPARILGIAGIAVSSLLGLDDLFKLARKVLKI
ncbi:MAG: hypothetical protein R3335_12410, partial [Anaerolineales bacterium]|nr:hypothetical protein [Anaerolineales bacterium]